MTAIIENPSILVPRPRRLRGAKRAMGTRMLGKLNDRWKRVLNGITVSHVESIDWEIKGAKCGKLSSYSLFYFPRMLKCVRLAIDYRGTFLESLIRTAWWCANHITLAGWTRAKEKCPSVTIRPLYGKSEESCVYFYFSKRG